MDHTAWRRAVVTVGAGRGFVIGGERGRYIVTAGHCLPHVEDGWLAVPCMTFSSTEERTFAGLLGPLGSEPTIMAEVLFVDPIADLAVLGSPDSQELSDEAEAYEALAEAAEPLRIGRPSLIRTEHRFGDDVFFGPAQARLRGWLLSLDMRWFGCELTAHSRALTIDNAAEKIAGGMSGSPIMSVDGEAVGIVVTNLNGSHPFLSRQLPGWLLDEVAPK